MRMESRMSRRQFGAGLAALAFAGAARTAECGLPEWAARLRVDLENMARELTARLQPWHGPQLVVRPEDFGYRPTQRGLATRAIQAAIDAAAERGGGTVRLANGDYVSGTIDLRNNIA